MTTIKANNEDARKVYTEKNRNAQKQILVATFIDYIKFDCDDKIYISFCKIISFFLLYLVCLVGMKFSWSSLNTDLFQ